MAVSLIFIAFLGGLLPALLWLMFWLMEDRCEPEPKRYIFFSFIAGMLLVVPIPVGSYLFGIVLPLEKFAAAYFSGATLLVVWAAIEEVCKFLAAYLVALRTRVFDEPLDAVIYLVTVALGFSAAENMLFLLGPLQEGNTLQAIATGNLRFMGATLLHTLSSATIGIALAFAFYRSFAVRRMAALSGVILAVLLHAVFNFFILNRDGDITFWIFLAVWFGVIAVLLFIERVKHPVRDYC
jgi:RsiW-degrading membrane proteinase PrsW (M82 family)